MEEIMLCPYNIRRILQVNQNRYEYDDDSKVNTYHEHKLIETRQMMECPKGECAAWYKGRCRYAAVSLDNE